MDAATFYMLVILLITLIIVAVGVYLILILHETRRSLQRINNLLDRIDKVSAFFENNVLRPSASFVNIASIVKEGMELFSQIKTTLGKEKGNDEPR